MNTLLKSLLIILFTIVIKQSNACDCLDSGDLTPYDQLLEEGAFMWKATPAGPFELEEENEFGNFGSRLYKLIELYSGNMCSYAPVVNLNEDSLIHIAEYENGFVNNDCFYSLNSNVADTFLLITKEIIHFEDKVAFVLNNCFENKAAIINDSLFQLQSYYQNVNTTFPYNESFDNFIDTLSHFYSNPLASIELQEDTIIYFIDNYAHLSSNWQTFSIHDFISFDICDINDYDKIVVSDNDGPASVVFLNDETQDSLTIGFSLWFSPNIVDRFFTAELFLCSDLNICDTIPINLSIRFPSSNLQDDYYSTTNSESISFNPIENDDLNLDFQGYLPEIISNPNYGMVNFSGWNNGEYDFIYEPTSDSTFIDSIKYRICSNLDCDTATMFFEQYSPQVEMTNEIIQIQLYDTLQHIIFLNDSIFIQRNLQLPTNQYQGRWNYKAYDNQWLGDWPYDYFDYNPYNFSIDINGDETTLKNLYGFIRNRAPWPGLDSFDWFNKIEDTLYKGKAEFILDTDYLEFSTEFPIPTFQQFNITTSMSGYFGTQDEYLIWQWMPFFSETNKGFMMFKYVEDASIEIIQEPNHINVDTIQNGIQYRSNSFTNWEEDSIIYEICIKSGHCFERKIEFQNPSNHSPILSVDTFAIIQASNSSFYPLLNDTDPNGDSLFINDMIYDESIFDIQFEADHFNITPINPFLDSGTSNLMYEACDTFFNCSFENIAIKIEQCEAPVSYFDYQFNLFTNDTISFYVNNSSYNEPFYDLELVHSNHQGSIYLEYSSEVVWKYVPPANFTGKDTLLHFAGTVCSDHLYYRFVFDVDEDTTQLDENVWPGDSNNDGIASNFDLLSIGLNYNKTGQDRLNATSNWIGQSAFNWSNAYLGLNDKHSDCNGDGIVSEADIDAILQNYNSTHNESLFTQPPYELSDIYPDALSDIFLVPQTDTVFTGDTVRIPIYLGDGSELINDVYGIAFSVYYDTTIIVPNSVSINFNDGWIADEGDYFDLSVDQYSIGKVDAAITRFDQISVNGSGQIGELVVVIIDNLDGKDLLQQTTTASTQNIFCVDGNKDRLDINNSSLNLIVEEKVTNSINDIDVSEIELYPNPTKGLINFNQKANKIESISLYSADGTYIMMDNQTNNLTFDIRHLPGGLYWLRFQLQDGSFQNASIIKY